MAIPSRSVWASTSTPDRYRNALMCACANQVTLAGATFSLFNNGQRGRYLFVYGCQLVVQSGSAVPVTGYAFHGKQTGGTDVVTFPLKFDEAVGEGVATYGTGGGTGGATSIVAFSTNEVGAYNWANPWPIAIIPAGFSFALSVAAGSSEYSFSFQWYSGEPLDFRALLTEDVADFFA
jgi:hypothetical protein